MKMLTKYSAKVANSSRLKHSILTVCFDVGNLLVRKLELLDFASTGMSYCLAEMWSLRDANQEVHIMSTAVLRFNDKGIGCRHLSSNCSLWGGMTYRAAVRETRTFLGTYMVSNTGVRDGLAAAPAPPPQIRKNLGKTLAKVEEKLDRTTEMRMNDLKCIIMNDVFVVLCVLHPLSTVPREKIF